MITPALIAEEVSRSTYRRVAAARGLTVGQVAGMVRRHRNPLPPRAPVPLIWRDDSPTEDAILVLMADGRMRTAGEIAARVGAAPHTVRLLLHRLADKGCMVIVQRYRIGVNKPWIWQEAPE